MAGALVIKALIGSSTGALTAVILAALGHIVARRWSSPWSLLR